MLQWYERLPDRLKQEEDAYAERGFNLDLNQALLQQKGLVVFDGTIDANDGEHSLRVVYSRMFPRVGVEVLDTGKKYRRHQNPREGNLCLPGWEPNWSGADKVQEAIELINLLGKTPAEISECEIPAPEPESTWYKYSPNLEVLVPELLSSTATGDRGTFTLALHNHVPFGGIRQAAIVEVYDIPSESRSSLDFGPFAVGERITGYWIRVSEAPPFELSSYDEWVAWAIDQNSRLRHDLEKQEKVARNKTGQPIVFAIVYPEEGPYQEYHDQWQVCVRWINKTHVVDWIMKPYLLPSMDTFFQRMPFLSKLSGKRVAVIGVGALGSVIATELARVGITEFALIDHDVLKPGNVVRHSGDLRAFGLPKVTAVGLQIRYINPLSTIRELRLRIGEVPLLPDQSVIDDLDIVEVQIGESDLVISTICNSAVEGWIDEMARSKGIPSIYAGVFYGAWGGQVFLSRPDGACFDCYDQSEKYADVSVPSERPLMYLDGCGDPSFPGASFDTSIIANLATRLSVQVLLDGEGYPRAPYNLISWSSREETGNEFPRVKLDTVESNPDCQVCDQ